MNSRFAPARVPAEAMPPITAIPGMRALQTLRKSPIGNEYGLGEHEHRAPGRYPVGPADDLVAVVGLECLERDRVDPPRTEGRGQHRQTGRLFDLDPAARDPDHRAADRGFGFEELAQTAHDVLERTRVVGRGEADEQVRPSAVEPLEDLARDLAHCFDRCGMQRERGRVAVHEFHSLRGSTPNGVRLSAITRFRPGL